MYLPPVSLAGCTDAADVAAHISWLSEVTSYAKSQTNQLIQLGSEG